MADEPHGLVLRAKVSEQRVQIRVVEQVDHHALSAGNDDAVERVGRGARRLQAERRADLRGALDEALRSCAPRPVSPVPRIEALRVDRRGGASVGREHDLVPRAGEGQVRLS